MSSEKIDYNSVMKEWGSTNKKEDDFDSVMKEWNPGYAASKVKLPEPVQTTAPAKTNSFVRSLYKGFSAFDEDETKKAARLAKEKEDKDKLGKEANETIAKTLNNSKVSTKVNPLTGKSEIVLPNTSLNDIKKVADTTTNKPVVDSTKLPMLKKDYLNEILQPKNQVKISDDKINQNDTTEKSVVTDKPNILTSKLDPITNKKEIETPYKPTNFIKKTIGEKTPVDEEKTPGVIETIKNTAKSLYVGASQMSSDVYKLADLLYTGSSKVTAALLPESIYNTEDDTLYQASHKKLQGLMTTIENQNNDIRKDYVNDKGIVNKVLTTAGEAIPAIITTMFTGAGLAEKTKEAAPLMQSLLTTAKKANIMRMLPFSVQAGGGYARKAEQDGANYEQQVLYGIVGGLAEGVTEAPIMSKWVDMFGKKTMQTMMHKGGKELTKTLGKVGVEWLTNVGAEAFQEAIVDPMTGIAEKSIYNPNKKVYGDNGVIDPKAMKSDAFGGMSMALVLGGLGLPSTYASHKIATKYAKDGVELTQNDIDVLHKQYDTDTQKLTKGEVKKIEDESPEYLNLMRDSQDTQNQEDYQKQNDFMANGDFDMAQGLADISNTLEKIPQSSDIMEATKQKVIKINRNNANRVLNAVEAQNNKTTETTPQTDDEGNRINIPQDNIQQNVSNDGLNTMEDIYNNNHNSVASANIQDQNTNDTSIVQQDNVQNANDQYLNNPDANIPLSNKIQYSVDNEGLNHFADTSKKVDTDDNNGISDSQEIKAVNIKSIGVDPERFQFKANTNNSTGTGEKLTGTEKFDKNKAGVVTVWQDKFGKSWIVNGHHRVELANRTNTENINAIILKESDGIDDKQARTIGALQNIGEGMGTPKDAAQVFKENNYTLEDLKDTGLSTKDKFVDQGYNISKLNDRLYHHVTNENLSYDKASTIGKAFPNDSKENDANQNAIMDYIQGNNPNNNELTEAIYMIKGSQNGMIDDVDENQQMSLDGLGSTNIMGNNFASKMKLISGLKHTIVSDKNVFNKAIKNSGILTDAGNVLNTEGNSDKKVLLDNVLKVIDQGKGKKGDPINNILNTYASKIGFEGMNTKAAIGHVTDEIVDYMSNNNMAEQINKVDNSESSQTDLFGGASNDNVQQGNGEVSNEAKGNQQTSTGTGTGTEESRGTIAKATKEVASVNDNTDNQVVTNNATAKESSIIKKTEITGITPETKKEVVENDDAFTYSENDINYDTIKDAYRMISHSPEERAISTQKQYVSHMKELQNNLTKYAETPAQKKILNNELKIYKEKYIKLQNSVLASTAKTASPMITGPAKFPFARNNKAMETEHKRIVEFLEFMEKAQNSIKKKILNGMSADQSSSAEYKRLEKEVISTISTLKDIENGSGYNASSFKTGLSGMLKRSANNGHIEEVKKALVLVQELEKKHLKKPVFAKNNLIWEHAEKAEQKIESAPTGEVSVVKYGGAEIINNYDAERMQILFDVKPPTEVTEKLSKAGWHYSRTNSAWQRKITLNSERSAKAIVSQFHKEVIVPTKTEKLPIVVKPNKEKPILRSKELEIKVEKLPMLKNNIVDYNGNKVGENLEIEKKSSGKYIAYHGTKKSGFTRFGNGKPIWFAKTTEMANVYTGQGEQIDKTRSYVESDNPGMYKLILDIKNPFILDRDIDEFPTYSDASKTLGIRPGILVDFKAKYLNKVISSDGIKILKSELDKNGVIVKEKDYFDETTGEQFYASTGSIFDGSYKEGKNPTELQDKLILEYDFAINSKQKRINKIKGYKKVINEDRMVIPLYVTINTPEYKEKLERMGYDGIIALDQGEVTYAVFDNSQIKNAISGENIIKDNLKEQNKKLEESTLFKNTDKSDGNKGYPTGAGNGIVTPNIEKQNKEIARITKKMDDKKVKYQLYKNEDGIVHIKGKSPTGNALNITVFANGENSSGVMGKEGKLINDEVPAHLKGRTTKLESKQSGPNPSGLNFNIRRTDSDVNSENQINNNSKYEFADEELARRYNDSHGVEEKTRISKIKSSVEEVVNMSTRTFRNIESNEKNSEFIKEMVQYPKLKNLASDDTIRILDDVTYGLNKNTFNTFSRKVLLDDLLEEVNSDHLLPLGFTPESVKSELLRIEPYITNEVREALDKRTKYWDTIKDEYVNAMGEMGIDISTKFNRKNYFRHQVLEYINVKNAAANAIKGEGNKLKTPLNRGFSKERAGTTMDINTDYLQAEYEVMAQMVHDKAVAQMIVRIKNNYDISDTLKAEAKKLRAEAKSKGEELKIVWTDLLPEGHSVWQPREGNAFISVNTLSEKMINDLTEGLADEINVKAGDIKKAMAMGGKYKQYVIPTEIANKLDELYKITEKNVLSKGSKKILGAWKQWVLTINPLGVVKYNIRNMVGDLDAVMLEPGVVKYSSRSAREVYAAMKNGVYTKDLKEFRDVGGFEDLTIAQEIGDVNKAMPFDRFKDKKSLPNLFKKYTDTTSSVSNYRESILRYASFLYYKQALTDGKVKYGASNPKLVKGLHSTQDKAYKLSKDLLGAYDEISETGQVLRDHWIPFFSWVEVNFKRYTQAFKNAGSKDIAIEQLENKGKNSNAVNVALKRLSNLGTTSSKAMIMTVMLMLWNALMHPDDEDKLPNSARDTPHIILGNDKDGKIIYFNRLGSFSDYLDWFSLDNIQLDISDIQKGRKTIKEQLISMAQAPVNKIVNSITPFVKVPAEFMAGKKTYPDVFNMSTIRNKPQYLAQSASLGVLYNRLMSIPMQGGIGDDMQNAIVYKSDPKLSAYYNVLDLKSNFEKQRGKEPSSTYATTPKSNALYYYKLSLKYDDEKTAEKWLNKYIELGGTSKGMDASMAFLNSLHGYEATEYQELHPNYKNVAPKLEEKSKLLNDFTSSLTPKEKEQLELAKQYYNELVNASKKQLPMLK